MSPPPPSPDYDHRFEPPINPAYDRGPARTFERAPRTDLNSKIMLAAVVSLAVVIVIVTALHVYARCILGRRRRRRRRDAVFRTRALNLGPDHSPPLRGLDPVVIASLPIFAYRQTDGGASTECAVCLSLLEDQEMARVLPNCRHTFHAECIDKWFGSRSTCPICRTEAEPRVRPVPRDGPIGGAYDLAMIPPPVPNAADASEGPPLVSDGNDRPSPSGCKAAGGSSSRLSSFRRMLSFNASSTGRVHGDDGFEDVERQASND